MNIFVTRQDHLHICILPYFCCFFPISNNLLAQFNGKKMIKMNLMHIGESIIWLKLNRPNSSLSEEFSILLESKTIGGLIINMFLQLFFGSDVEGAIFENILINLYQFIICLWFRFFIYSHHVRVLIPRMIFSAVKYSLKMSLNLGQAT